MPEGFITIEEATKSNTTLFGVMFLLAVAVGLFSWLYVRREQRIMKKAIRRIVARAVKKAVNANEKEIGGRLAKAVIAWQIAEDALKEVRDELAAVTKERDELRASLDSLEAVAAGCPASGVRVKKGSFNADAA